MKTISIVSLATCLFCLTFKVHGQVITITKPVYTYKQNFDSLASSGSSSGLPYGWSIYETGTGANTNYTADSGASSTGDTYSYGHKGSTDRALGTLAAGGEISYFGAQFKNSTGYSINSITVAFTIEQWRLGATGRADSLIAEVTTLATSISSGFWVSLSPLNIHSVVTSGTTGQLDGNNPANRVRVSYTLSGISVADGSNLWIRWRDQNISGANDGLAIDDFSLSVKAYIPHTIVSTKFPQTLGVPDTTQTGLWTGVVLAPNYRLNGLYFPFKDNSGSITAISNTKTYGYTPAIGDSVAVYGKIQSAGYLTYIAVDSVGLISSGKNPGPAKIVTNINSDTLESSLVRINNLNLAPGYKWDTTGSSKSGLFMTTVSNGTKTYNVWISNSTNIFGNIAPKFPFNLTGIVLQNSNSPTTGYLIAPRSASDFDTIRLPLYKISQVRGQNLATGISDSAGNGHLIFLKGVVNSPSLTTPASLFSLIDNTGAISVSATSSLSAYKAVIGDSVLVRGMISQINGLTVIVVDSIRKLPKGIAGIKSPSTIIKVVEVNESSPVKFLKAHIVDASAWVPSGTFFMVKYTNGADTINVAIYNNTDLYKLTSPPFGNFNITGISGQYKIGTPFTSGYQLWPRGLSDFEKILAFSPLPLYKINQLKGYNALTGVTDSLNKGKGFIKGVVHCASFNSAALNFSLIDNTGAITVFSSSIKYYIPAIGDSILIHGNVIQTNGLTEYLTDTIILLTKGIFLKTPSITSKLNETTESDIIKIKNVYLTDTTTWIASSPFFNVKITNGKDTFIMRINNTVDLYKKAAPKGVFNITGIGSQDKSSAPYTSGYIIEPRGLFDFEHVIQFYKIKDVRGQNAVSGISDSINGKNRFLLKGIVQSPDYTSPGLSFSITDNTGSIFISSVSKTNGYSPVIGDSIEVRGIITQLNGLTAIIVDSISKLTSSAPVLTPTVVATLNESLEANLVKYNNARLIDPTQWKATGAYFDVDVTNGLDTIKLRISGTINLYSKPAPKGKFNITGICTQSKASAPFIGGYLLMPRSVSDLQPLPVKLYQINQVKGYNSTSGIADSIQTYCFLKGVVLSENLSPNTGQFFMIKDNTGAITLSAPGKVNGYIQHVGDSIKVRGTVLQDNGLTYFEIDSIAKLVGATNIPPIVVTKLDETTESNLVKLIGYRLVDASKWDTTGGIGHFIVKAYKLTDTITLVIFASTDLYRNNAVPNGKFDVTGIGSQNDGSPPYLGSYLLIPRGKADFYIYPPPAKLYKIGQIKGYNKATGVADSIGTYCKLKGVVESGNLSADNSQSFPIKDNTGAITLTAPAMVGGYSALEGDTLEVVGTVRQTNGLTHFDVDSIQKISTGPIVLPVVFSKNELSDSMESSLIAIYYNLFKLVDSSKWDTTGGKGMFMVKAFYGNDTINLLIYKSTDLYSNAAKPSKGFCIAGIYSQNDPTQPYLQNYYIIPRSKADLVPCSGGIGPFDELSQKIRIFPNPANDQVNINADFVMDKVQLVDVIGQVVAEASSKNHICTLDISNAKPGVYFLKISHRDSEVFRKLIKE